MSEETLISVCASRRMEMLQQARRQGKPAAAAGEIDRMVTSMFQRIMDMTAEERLGLIQRLSKSESDFLLTVASEAAVFSVREQAPEQLQEGLLALLLANGRFDRRRSIMRLCLLCHSASLLEVSIEELFGNVRQYGTPETAETFDSYFQKGEKSISAMGYEVSHKKGGFSYRQIR